MMAEPGQPQPEQGGLPAGNDVTTRKELTGAAETRPSRWPEILPPEIAALALQTLVAPAASENAVTRELTVAQTDRLIDQAGRKSDQAHNFKKWLLVFAGLAFCLILLTTVGLVVFLTLQGEVAFASEIVAGAFGLISGLVTGVGGTLGFIALRQWWQ